MYELEKEHEARQKYILAQVELNYDPATKVECLVRNLKTYALDYAVAITLGWKDHPTDYIDCDQWYKPVEGSFIGQPIIRKFRWQPSRDWAQGGPIIEENGIELKRGYGLPLLWSAYMYNHTQLKLKSQGITGSSPLEAAMRNFVSFKYGKSIEVPQHLIKLSTTD